MPYTPVIYFDEHFILLIDSTKESTKTCVQQIFMKHKLRESERFQNTFSNKEKFYQLTPCMQYQLQYRYLIVKYDTQND